MPQAQPLPCCRPRKLCTVLPLLLLAAWGALQVNFRDHFTEYKLIKLRSSQPHHGVTPNDVLSVSPNVSKVMSLDTSSMSGFPMGPISLAGLKACAPTIVKDSVHCPEDPTCYYCYNKSEAVAKTVQAAFADPERQTARRAKLRQLFGEPRADDPVIMFITNGGGFLSMLANWLCSVERRFPGLKERVLLLALDQSVVRWAEKAAVHYVYVGDYDIASFEGRSVGSQVKWTMWPLVSDLLESGYPVIFSDVDVMWVKDPRPIIAHDPFLTNIDIITQLAPRWDAQGTSNTGFIHLRSNFRTRIFAGTMMNALMVNQHVDDQVWFNQVLRHHKFRTITIRTMPRTLLSDGFLQEQKEEWLVVHIVSRPGGKREYLTKMGLWYNTEQCKCCYTPDS